MTFDRETFNQYLTTETFGRSLYTYEQVCSTNTTLGSLLQQGAPWGSTVIAAQQSGGRGQWGRTWESALGGLYLSVAIAPQLPTLESAHLTLASAWGVAKQLREQGIAVQLKWPNDLYLGSLKLGGILIETAVQQGTIQRAVIGIGLNWSNLVPPNAINLQQWFMMQNLSQNLSQSLSQNLSDQNLFDQDLAMQDLLKNLPIQGLEHLAALTVNGLECGYQILQEHGIKPFFPAYFDWLIGDCPFDLTNP